MQEYLVRWRPEHQKVAQEGQGYQQRPLPPHAHRVLSQGCYQLSPGIRQAFSVPLISLTRLSPRSSSEVPAYYLHSTWPNPNTSCHPESSLIPFLYLQTVHFSAGFISSRTPSWATFSKGKLKESFISLKLNEKVALFVFAEKIRFEGREMLTL